MNSTTVFLYVHIPTSLAFRLNFRKIVLLLFILKTASSSECSRIRKVVSYRKQEQMGTYVSYLLSLTIKNSKIVFL